MKTNRIALVVVASFFVALSLAAATEVVDGVSWFYAVSDGKASIVNEKWNTPAVSPSVLGELVVPSSLGGYPVTSIGYSAFLGCSALTGVTIPAGVTNIAARAFYGCSALARVTIPAGVTGIGWGAFEGCGVLLNVTIPAGVTNIANRTFYGCGALTDIILPADVTEIGDQAFCGCGSLTTLALPDGVTRVGWGAFGDCRALTGIAIPDSVTEIGGQAFERCDALAGVTIPDGVTEIGYRTFSDCSALTDVTIPASVTNLGGWVFENCIALTNVTFLGDAPLIDKEAGFIFRKTAAACTAFVRKESTGWGVAIPGTWMDIGIEYIDDEPESVTPNPEPVTPCYEILNASEIVAPYEAPRATTLHGAVYKGCNVVGIVELKLGKADVKKGTGKVSGSVTTLDGRRHAIKAIALSKIDGVSHVDALIEVKGLGTMAIAIGGSRFAGSMGGNHVQSAIVGGKWAKTSAVVTINVDDLSMFAGAVISELLPDAETASVADGRWVFAKAARVKWARPKNGTTLPDVHGEISGKGLVVDTSKGKTNLSGLKLTYAVRRGTFKGSFKLYELQGSGKTTKLKKYTVSVSGVVVDGVGYGMASLKNPAVDSWTVKLR